MDPFVPDLLNWVGFSIGLLGTALVIWGLLKHNVSLLGLTLMTAGFLLVALADLL